MKNLLCFSALAAATVLCSCQKQQTDAERNAEVERKVQERLAAERQAQDQQKLTQGQVDLDQRVKDLEAARANAAAGSAQQTTTSDEDERSERTGSRDASEGRATATYSTFYSRLEPEGEWRETSTYGYVWQPRVARASRDWRPYTNGRWVYTDAGWTWISEEPFGWATYHYGRWTRLRGIGWVWVPGNEWAPAWVSWRKSNDYVGWAPLPPEAHFERGTGIHNWADNYYDIGPEQYCFVPTNQLGDQRVERAVVPIDRNVTIINQTTNVTNITYNNKVIVNEGPSYDEMRSRSQQPIERLRLERDTQVDFQAAELHPVVRGEVVQMPAPVVAPAQPMEKPRRVGETVTNAVVDHEVDRVGDRQAFEQARMKMKNEATPPPNAPRKLSRRIQLPEENASTTPATAPTSTQTVPPVTPSPAASVRRELPTASRPRFSPSATATPSPVISTTPRATVAPTQAPSATPAITPSPTMTPFPQRSHTVPPSSTLQRTFPSPSVPLSPNLTQPQTSPSSAPARLGRGAGKEGRKAERQERRQGLPAQPSATAPDSSVTPSTSATPAASDSPGLSRREQRKEDRKEERRARRAGEQPGAPSPSPSPTAQ